MKNLIFICIVIAVNAVAHGQDIVGQWGGVLTLQEIKLSIIFNINRVENSYYATMDSPDQGVTDIPVTSISFEDMTLKLHVATAGIEYQGVLKSRDTIRGDFKQAGLSFSLVLIKVNKKDKNSIRPQEPMLPFSYHTEEVFFENSKDKIRLAGTLTLPKSEGNRYPAVILISGSGPQNRDSEIFGHKPFLVLADHLTKNGIAVLRLDDRGVGQSSGTFETATTLDFASDIQSAIQYLKSRKEINKRKIGLIGHSEGGIIAPMVASKTKKVNFVVLLAGPGLRGDKLLLLQKLKIEQKMGLSDTAIAQGQQLFGALYGLILNSKFANAALKEEIINYLTLNYDAKLSKNQIHSISNQLTTPWMHNFLNYDPQVSLKKIKCPVLAMNGEKDVQVVAKENLEAIKNILERGGNKKVMVKALPNLNHLFQECNTGLPNEYVEIEQTFSPMALDLMTKWILKQL